MSEHDYKGRLGLFWSWTESAGNNAAEMLWDGALYAGTMLFGFAWSHYVHPSSAAPVVQPAVPAAPKSFVGRLFQGFQEVITLPIKAVISPIETTKQIVNFGKNWLPQQVASNSILHPLVKKYVFDPMRPAGVAFFRPFMERMVPVVYSVFDASDLELSLRNLLISHKDNNPDALGKLLGWTGWAVGNVIVSPYKAWDIINRHFFNPKSIAENIAPKAYEFGDAAASFIGAPIGIFNNIIQATRNIGPCLYDHGPSECFRSGLNAMTKTSQTLWNNAEPIRRTFSDITSASLDMASGKIKDGIRNIPNMTVGELALYATGTAAVAGLAYWKLRRRTGAPLVVNNNVINNHAGAQPAQPVAAPGP